MAYSAAKQINLDYDFSYNKELSDFLRQQCKQRGLSLRGLSLNSGLSAATVQNMVKRTYQPTLYSLNRLADYLGVKREYLWQLAGVLEDMDYGAETGVDDPRMRHLLAQVDKLPEAARHMVINLVETVIKFSETAQFSETTQLRRTQD